VLINSCKENLQRISMKTLVLGGEQVTRLLPMNECIGVMRDCLLALARGQAVLPLRHILVQPDGVGLLAMMPAYLGNPPALGLKAISVFHGNIGTKHESHQGAVLLFETRNGRLLSMQDASSITAIRTAAVSGVATDLLARKNASTLGMLGSGTQAKTHLEAMLTVRSTIRKVRVWSRSAEHAKAFVQHESSRRRLEIEAVGSPREAVSGADIVCTTTSAKAPVLMGHWLSLGTHLNVVGAGPGVREVDGEAVAKSRYFVDRRESTVNEAEEFKVARQEALIGDDHIQGEIGEILAGKTQGRGSNDEITLFRSLGIAVEDLATAHYLYNQAVARNIGTWIEFNQERH
jgi:ornithine cyclodeaminase